MFLHWEKSKFKTSAIGELGVWEIRKIFQGGKVVYVAYMEPHDKDLFFIHSVPCLDPETAMKRAEDIEEQMAFTEFESSDNSWNELLTNAPGCYLEEGVN